MSKGNRGGGRPRKSIAQHKFEGSYRPDRHGTQEQAEKSLLPIAVSKAEFPVPKELTAEAVKTAFKNHVAMLDTIGYLCKSDYEELKQAYIYLEKFKEYQEQLSSMDMFDENYDLIFNRMNKAQSKFSEIGKKYLLSPEARLKFALDSLTAKDKAIEVSKKEKSITEQIIGGEAIV